MKPTVDEVLELARASGGVLGDAVVALLSEEPLEFLAVVGDARGHTVHLPREANRYYRPREARALGLMVLRAADAAAIGMPELAPADPEQFDSAADARAKRAAREEERRLAQEAALANAPTEDATPPAPVAARARRRG